MEKKNYSADLRSRSSEDLKFPYGKGIGAGLSIYRIGKSDSVMIQIDAGQLLCRSYGTCGVQIKFDNEPAQVFDAKGPENRETTYVFLASRDAKRFISKVKVAKQILIAPPIYQESGKAWIFDVAGLKWDS